MDTDERSDGPAAGPQDVNRPWSRVGIATLVPAVLAAVIGVFVPLFGHFHEDTYILLVYADHLASGEGIVFYPGGPPAEGATDFLWMVALALFQVIGVDLAVGLVVLTAVFAGVLGFLRDRFVDDEPVLVTLVAGAAIALSPFAGAAYVGFSAMVFAAMSVALWWLWFARKVDAVFVLALAIGLLRPDGVLLGAGFGLLALVEHRRRALAPAAIAAVVGLVYFAWRTWYFGAWLPLPLLVKGIQGNGGALPGLGTTLAWLAIASPLCLFAIGGALGHPSRRRLLLGGLPFLLHLLVLTTSYQSQNFLFRFQAPELAWLLVMATLPWPGRPIAPLRSVGPAVAAGFAALLYGKFTLGFLTAIIDKPTYMDVLPTMLEVPADTRVALTEAGRLPFWTRLPTMDLVGLNTLETAKEPARPEMIEAFDPDILMLHTLDSLPARDENTGAVIEVDASELVIEPPRPTMGTVVDALEAGYGFLKVHPEYQVFLVRYLGDYNHLWAVKRDSIDVDAFRATLEASQDRRASYWELRHAR